jgi:hypothetical protein
MIHSRRIGLAGDYDASVPAHQAIPRALQLMAPVRQPRAIAAAMA